MPRLMAYNIKFFTNCFDNSNNLRTAAAPKKQSDAVAEVIQAADPDLIGITEGPDDSAGNRDTVAALEGFAAAHGLRQNKALLGYRSNGRQEIALLYDPTVLTATHDPEGDNGSTDNPTFDKEFRADSDGDGIVELYKHYRPPLEARVSRADGGADFWVIVAHAKSKGIFDVMDRLHFDRTSERNRRKLFAECMSIRQRVDEWLDAGRRIAVMGDINDGAGFDFYESRFGRSAVEQIMGDVFAPDRVLRNVIGRPKWGDAGWEPSSVDFRDQFTGDKVNALIDHIMLSLDIGVVGGSALVWNPGDDAPAQVNAVEAALKDASDHFPITVDIT